MGSPPWPLSPCPVSPCPVSACPVSPCPVSPCPLSPCPVSPCPVSPLVSWPAPVPESELEVFPWSLLAVLLWHGLLDTNSTMQRQNANWQAAAMLGKKNLSTHLGWLKCSGQPQIVSESLISVLCLLLPSQVSFTLFSYMSTSLSNLTHCSPVSALLSAKDTAFYFRWGSAHPDASLSPPTLYPDQLVWPLYSIEELMLLSFYSLGMLYEEVFTEFP